MPATDSKKKPLGWKRRLRRYAELVIRAYLVFCLILYLGQDWLAFPGSSSQGKADNHINFGRTGDVVHLATANQIPIAAVFSNAAGPSAPTILYFYGNGGSVALSEGEFDHFRELGCNVLIPDLAGYGDSGGKPSETNFYATADAAWDFLQSRPEIDKSKIIIVGWSMGAGVAIDLASRKHVLGLATFNAFTTLPAMARVLIPWVPTGLLLKYRFDNLAKISTIHRPMFICNGRMDTLVPPKMSDDLAAHAGGPITRLTINSADHNSIFVAEPDVVWSGLGAWIKQLR